jgi:hypothetical protein
LKRIVTGDESWWAMKVCVSYTIQEQNVRVHFCSLQTKKPKAQKERIQKSRMKTMLTAFYDAKDFIHREFVRERETAKYKLCKYMIKELIALVLRVSHEAQETGS